MSTSLSVTARASINWGYSKTNSFGNPSLSSNFSFQDTLANGTGAGQSDLLYLDAPTVAASGNKQYDLSGSLLTVFGDACVFARVKSVFVGFQTGNTASDVSIGGGTDGAGAAAFVGWFGAAAHKENVHKSGVGFHYRNDATGWAVTATTADILRITNNDSGNAALLNVAVVGASA